MAINDKTPPFFKESAIRQYLFLFHYIGKNKIKIRHNPISFVTKHKQNELAIKGSSKASQYNQYLK